jgi:hypothetical protein
VLNWRQNIYSETRIILSLTALYFSYIILYSKLLCVCPLSCSNMYSTTLFTDRRATIRYGRDDGRSTIVFLKTKTIVLVKNSIVQRCYYWTLHGMGLLNSVLVIFSLLSRQFVVQRTNFQRLFCVRLAQLCRRCMYVGLDVFASWRLEPENLIWCKLPQLSQDLREFLCEDLSSRANNMSSPGWVNFGVW